MLGIVVALTVAFFRETYIDAAALVLCILTMSVRSCCSSSAGSI